MSADSTLGAGDRPLGESIIGNSPLGSLEPGDSFTGVLGASVDFDLQVFSYLILEVDTGGAVYESDETNNRLAVLYNSNPTVNDPPNVPLLTISTSQTVIGNPVNFEALSSDPESDLITYELRVQESGGQTWIVPMGPAETSGVAVNYRSDFTDWGLGTFAIQARASDSNNPATAWSVTQTVVCTDGSSLNEAPSVPLLKISTNQTVIGDPVDFEVVSLDPENDLITYELRVAKSGGRTRVFQLGNPELSGIPVSYRNDFTNWGVGTFTIQARASDGNGDPSEWSERQTVECEDLPPPPSVLAIDDEDEAFGETGGDHSFGVTSNTSWSWRTSARWTRSSQLSDQSGDQEFTYSVDPNPLASSRNAEIHFTIDGVTRIHTVTQAGFSVPSPLPALSLSGKYRLVNFSGEEHAINVDSNTVWSWSSGVPWLTSQSEPNQSGDQVFRYSVAENPSREPRGGEITFMAEGVVLTYLVTQEGAPPPPLVATLVVRESEKSFDSSEGSHSIQVLSNSSWNWSSSASWITTNEGVNQTGDQSFSYSLAANPTVAGRSADIIFRSGSLMAIHTVIQEAAATPGDPEMVVTNKEGKEFKNTDRQKFKAVRVGRTGSPEVFSIRNAGESTLVEPEKLIPFDKKAQMLPNSM